MCFCPYATWFIITCRPFCVNPCRLTAKRVTSSCASFHPRQVDWLIFYPEEEKEEIGIPCLVNHRMNRVIIRLLLRRKEMRFPPLLPLVPNLFGRSQPWYSAPGKRDAKTFNCSGRTHCMPHIFLAAIPSHAAKILHYSRTQSKTAV